MVLTILSIFFLISLPLRASEIYPFFRSVRQEAMGGASVAVVNDETAIFLNPAGLGKIRSSVIALVNPELETNYDTNAALATGLNYAAVLNPQALLAVAQSNPGKHLHARVQVLPALVTTNFELAAYANYTMNAEYTSSTSLMHLDYQNDYGAAMAYCFRLFDGRLKIGASGKLINRVYINTDILSSSTNASIGNLASEGDGVGWDGGVLLTLPWMFLPTIGAVAHDIGNTTFKLSNGYFYKPGTYPPPQFQSVDVAFAIYPIQGNHTRSSITVEWHDAQNPETADPYRRLHVGAEMDFGDIFYLRGGMNQRYYTAGIEFDLMRQQIQLSTYGEEIGTPTVPREDRRFTVMYGFRF